MFLPMQLPGVDQEQIAQVDSLLKANIKAEAQSFAGMTWEERLRAVLNDLLDIGLRVVVVIAVFMVGRWLIRHFIKLMNTIFERRGVDPSLRSFVRGMTNITLYAVLIYLVITWLGVNTSLFVAMFAAAGLAIGMALSGVFQNFAGGVMILLLKPFQVGDWIEVQSQSGKVTDIKLFSTELRTVDNKTILLPNGSVSTAVVNNYNVARTRRVEWIASVIPGTDLAAARSALLGIIGADRRVLPDPAPEVVVGKLNTSSLDLIVHAWVASDDNQDVFYDINAAIYKTLPEMGFAFALQPLSVTLQNPGGTQVSTPPSAPTDQRTRASAEPASKPSI